MSLSECKIFRTNKNSLENFYLLTIGLYMVKVTFLRSVLHISVPMRHYLNAANCTPFGPNAQTASKLVQNIYERRIVSEKVFLHISKQLLLALNPIFSHIIEFFYRKVSFSRKCAVQLSGHIASRKQNALILNT